MSQFTMAKAPISGPILCFQHCNRNSNILCFSLPESCPMCGLNLETVSLRIPPFALPSPFHDARTAPCSLVVRPTSCDFLRHYDNSEDLHIGVTDSQGYVYDYNERGLNQRSTGWEECISITLLERTSLAWRQEWDKKLRDFAKSADWIAERYSDKTHNCYDFALGFLRYLGLNKTIPEIDNKIAFCTARILPKTTQAAKYITVFRKVQTAGVVIQPKGDSHMENMQS